MASIYIHSSFYCRIAPVCDGVIFLHGKILFPRLCSTLNQKYHLDSSTMKVFKQKIKLELLFISRAMNPVPH